MDPIATSFATIVSLAASFVSERRAQSDANLEEFKAWLAGQRHDGIIKLLESNMATAIGTKALLHESHSQIVDRLRQIEQQIASTSTQAERAAPQEGVGVIETIWLGVNNNFAGTNDDLADLATRCAIHVIEGKKVEFQVSLQGTVLSNPPEDPLALPRYEKARLERARALKLRLEILTSQAVHEWWQYFLSRKEDWGFAMKSLLLHASLAASGQVIGKKVDVWRTEEPALSAPIYLDSEEIASALQYLKFQSLSDLRMGPYWRAALDLPFDLISRHVIPSIIVQLERKNIPCEGSVLDLAAWHIGEG